MLARRIQPVLNPMSQFRQEMNRLFEDVFEELPLLTQGTWRGRGVAPPVNVWQDDEHVYVELEIPGFRADQVEITVLGDELTIKGDRKKAGEEDRRYLIRERGEESFSRVVRLPVAVQDEHVKAELSQGVLTLCMPKAPEAVTHKIKVKQLTD